MNSTSRRSFSFYSISFPSQDNIVQPNKKGQRSSNNPLSRSNTTTSNSITNNNYKRSLSSISSIEEPNESINVESVSNRSNQLISPDYSM